MKKFKVLRGFSVFFAILTILGLLGLDDSILDFERHFHRFRGNG